MSPSISLSLQESLKNEITEYTLDILRGFYTKNNINDIIKKHIDKGIIEMKEQGFNIVTSKKYGKSLVNSFAQGVLLEINK